MYWCGCSNNDQWIYKLYQTTNLYHNDILQCTQNILCKDIRVKNDYYLK